MLHYEDLTPNQKAFFLANLYNGMGDSMIAPPSLIFANAAEFHDFYSFLGGTEADRVWATKEFLHKSHDAVRQQSLWKRPFYYFISYTYYWVLYKADAMTWTYLEKPADTWPEFINNCIFYYKTRNESIAPSLIDAINIK